MAAREDRPPRQVPRDPAVRGGRWVPGRARLLNHGRAGLVDDGRGLLFSSVSTWSGAGRLSVAARNDGRAEPLGSQHQCPGESIPRAASISIPASQLGPLPGGFAGARRPGGRRPGPRPGAHVQVLEVERWARRGVGFHGDGGDVPSTITRFTLAALSRMASNGAYSGESYQRRALSTLGNSSSTLRFGCQAPSRIPNVPPAPAKRPPYFSTVAGTSLRSSASPGSSCTSISTIT